MKLNDRYWIYEMTCLPSGKVYIGQTGKPNPCWRWADHFVELRNRISGSPLLQKEWDKYSKITDWQFRALDEVNGKRTANYREAELIFEVKDEMRLNTKSTSTVSFEKRSKVIEMLKEGRIYKDIVAEVGLSMGMISKIKRQEYFRS